MKAKHLILIAKALSAVFSPFHLPVVGLIILFLFSYLSFLPWSVKLYILLMVYTFTILLPTAMIRLYRRYQGWNRIELGVKERRMVPYVISIIYFFILFIYYTFSIPFILFKSTIILITIIIIYFSFFILF